MRAYWTALWQAGGDRPASRPPTARWGGRRRRPRRRARRGLLARATSADPPPGTATRAETRCSSPSCTSRPTRTPSCACTAGPAAPRARLLPDRLVFLGYDGGEQVARAARRADPAAAGRRRRTLAPPEDDQLEPDGGELQVGPGAAVGGRLRARGRDRHGVPDPADAGRRRARLRRLVVLGVRLRADRRRRAGRARGAVRRTTTSSQAGFAVLPQGTPDQQHRGRPVGATAGARTPTTASTALRLRRRPIRRDWLRQARRQLAGRAAGPRPGRAARRCRATAGTDQRRRPRDERRAVAGDARLLHGEHAGPGVRDGDDRRRGSSSPDTSPAAAPSPRSGSAGSPTASCPPPRGRGCGGSARRARPGRADAWDLPGHGSTASSARWGPTWRRWSPGVLHRQARRRPAADLLDVIGLHPALGGVPPALRRERHRSSTTGCGSAGGGSAFLAALVMLGYTAERRWRCSSGSGYPDADAADRPTSSRSSSRPRPTSCTGALVDDGPLSETDGVRPYTDDGRNYLALARSGGRPPRTTRCGRQEGFTDGAADARCCT